MRIQRVWVRVAALLATVLTTSVLVAPTPSQAVDTVPTADELAQTGADQQRWLSLPDSRVVLNPFDFRSTASALQQSSGPQLPLNAGYYAGDSAFPLNGLVAMYQQPAGSPPGGGTSIGYRDDFTTLSPDWQAEAGLQTQVQNGALALNIAAGGPPWAALTRWVTVDLDQHPVVQIRVNQAGGGSNWALKVNDGTQAVDTFVQSNTAATGALTYNIPALTGWSGTKTFKIRIFVIGQGAPVLVDDLRAQSDVDPWLRTTTGQSHSWLPYTLPFTATYADGMSVAGQDYLHDRDSVTRTVSLQGIPTDGSKLVFSGKYSGTLSFDSANRQVTVRSGSYEYSVRLPGVNPQITYYETENDLLVGGPVLSTPASSGVWAVQLDPPAGQTSLSTKIGVGFATTAEPAGTSAQRAAAASTSSGPAQWETFWDTLLAGVPHPQNFAITAVDTKGVTPAQVRATYYRAWVFMFANVLPAQPEAGFAYRQLVEGKPSMWTEGADGARASTSWTSFMAMQYLAYVDPDLAWETFEGMISLVDADGEIGGEGLPTRRAQTAWILYQVTGDATRLAASYSDLKRNIVWSADNPRWIYGTHDYPSERDADFVVSALLDIRHAEQIAGALGYTADVTFWQQEYTELFNNYLTWFWATPTSEPRQYYDVVTGSFHRGNTMWTTQGLHVPTLSGDYLTGMINRFMADFDPTADFGGFAFPNVKFAEIENTIYGLLDQGYVTEANQLNELVLRDVIRSGQFAEVYDQGPIATGVRPALFGVLNVINAVLLANGVRIDQGEPMFVALPGDNGGVNGLSVRGKTLGATVSTTRQNVYIAGSLVRGPRECRILDAPIGTTVGLPRTCLTA